MKRNITAVAALLAVLALLLVAAETLPAGSRAAEDAGQPAGDQAAQGTGQPAPDPAVEDTGQPARSQIGEDPGQPAPAPAGFRPVVETVASGLEVPWAMAFAPDGRLFFTERPGRLRVISGGELSPDPVAVLPAVSTGESGLMGLAIDPAFEENGYLYVMYSYRPSGRSQIANRVSRLTVDGAQASDETVLLDGIAGASIHDGGRLRIGPDGKLYITTGDAAQTALSQDLGSINGKILRINLDGTIPEDNPFPGTPVWTRGHRNPEGLAFHPESGILYSTEHGPAGNDEVNIIEAGRSYGWPTVSGQAGDDRFAEPIAAYSPSVAPGGATFYDGDQLGEWKGSLFFGTLRGQHLHRLVPQGDDPRSLALEERLFEGVYGRIRDVIQGPDGYLYFSTSNRDGRGSPDAEDDRILRIVPGGG